MALFKSPVVELLQDATGVFSTEGKDNGGVGGKKGYIYSSSCAGVHILGFVG
jgi:hypothetical protein